MEMFAYGVYDDYLQNKSTLPPLSPAMLTKLRHLTLVTLASNQKTLPLEILVNKLSLNTRRELEDLIIEAIYAGEENSCNVLLVNGDISILLS